MKSVSALRSGLFPVLLVISACLPLTAQPTAGSIVTRAAPLFGPAIIDAAGNLYSAGNSVPGQYAVTPGAAQTQPGGGTNCVDEGLPGQPCTDAYIIKVDSAGNTVFATYLGGPTADNAATLAVDTAGEVFVAGTTGGSFPTTANAALVTIPASGTFVAKLNANGSKMIYSTYLPASMATVSAMALDPDGNVYVTGTSSTGHVAVVKLSPDGSAFIYYQELAGSGQDAGTAIAVDAGGNAAIAGSTTSADFPVSAGSLQPHLLGAQNAFVAELGTGGNVVFSTYLGGSGSDAASSVQIDAAGNTYVAGSTTSMDLPTTQGVFQPAPMVPMWATSPGGFVAKLVPGGSSLAYASYVMSDAALVLSPYVVPGVAGLAVDSQGEVYLDGVTGAGFSVTASAPQACFGGSRDVLYSTWMHRAV